MVIDKTMLSCCIEGRAYQIPSHVIEGIDDYINKRIRPGSFLYAVFCNDLVNAFGKADMWNVQQMAAFAHFLYWHAPKACWGSVEKVEKWLNREGGI